MKCVFYTILWMGAMCGTLAAQHVPAVVTSHVKCAVEPPHYDHWYRESSLSQGKPYVATEGRKQQILSNYRKLKLHMSFHEVETLLGKPDFGTARPPLHLATAPEPKDLRCSNDLAYVVEKKSGSMIDGDDVAVYLSFSREGKLIWATPQNLPNLKQLGTPAGD